MSRVVLVVEDERLVAAFLARAVEEGGFTPHLSETVADGIRCLDESCPAALVVNYRLPDGTGLEVARRYLEICPQPATLCITGWPTVPLEDELVGLDGVTVLRKPFNSSELMECLGKVLAAAGHAADAS